METWKPLQPGYEISDMGRVRSLYRKGRTKGRVLKPSLVGRYASVTLPGRVVVKIHVEVMRLFVGPKPEGLVVRHLDDDVWNNALRNLRYGTCSENEFDKVRNGNNPHSNKTECPNGHQYDDQNTGWQGPGRRSRYCKTCNRDRARARRLA